MRDVSMVDTSRWDQSFVDVDTLASTDSNCFDRRRTNNQLFDFVIGLDNGSTTRWVIGPAGCLSDVDRKIGSRVKPTGHLSTTRNDVNSNWTNCGVSADDWFLAIGRNKTQPVVDRTQSADRIYQNTTINHCSVSDDSTVPPVLPRRASAGKLSTASRPCLLPPIVCDECPTSPGIPSPSLSSAESCQHAALRSSTSPMWNHRSAVETQTSASDRPVTNDGLCGSVAHAAYSQVASFLPQWDLERLEVVYRRLVSSGFYFGRMSIGEATERLGRWPVGSFLLRDSSDPRYLFSVSIQTCRGTTSIRMAYRSGLFRLDCSPDQEHLMPTFDCALRLVTHYVRLCAASVASAAASSSSAADRRNDAQQTSTRNGHSYVLLESSGRKDTPVLLTKPYRDQPASLGHLCRRTVHSRLTLGGCGDSGRDAAVDRLHLIPSLKTYLKDYPYDI